MGVIPGGMEVEDLTAAAVATAAIELGFNFSPRSQVCCPTQELGNALVGATPLLVPCNFLSSCLPVKNSVTVPPFRPFSVLRAKPSPAFLLIPSVFRNSVMFL